MMQRRHTSYSIALGALALVLACGGESKPAATAPNGSSDKDAADKTDGGKPIGEQVDAAKAGVQGENQPEKVKVVNGAPAGDDDRYALQIDTPEMKTGQAGSVVVRVVPKEPWHMNLDFPTSLKINAPAGVKLTNADLKKADAKKLDESACEFAVEVTPSAAGEQSFTG